MNRRKFVFLRGPAQRKTYLVLSARCLAFGSEKLCTAIRLHAKKAKQTFVTFTPIAKTACFYGVRIELRIQAG
jgi:hypothetical protein